MLDYVIEKQELPKPPLLMPLTLNKVSYLISIEGSIFRVLSADHGQLIFSENLAADIQ
jgi:hypothetical protein